MNTLEKEIKFLKSLKWDSGITMAVIRLLEAELGTEEFINKLRWHFRDYPSSVIRKQNNMGSNIGVVCLAQPKWVDSAHTSVSHLTSYASLGGTVFGACMTTQIPGYYVGDYRLDPRCPKCQRCLEAVGEIEGRGAVIR